MVSEAIKRGQHPNSRAALVRARPKALRKCQSAEAKAKRSSTRKMLGLDRSPAFLEAAAKHRMRGLALAREAARAPSAKRKRQESLEAWRAENQGAPGAPGLAVREAVALFLASHPHASDAEVARATGIGLHRIRLHRDPASRRVPIVARLRAKVNRDGMAATIKRLSKVRRITERVSAFLENVAAGKPLQTAAKAAGYSSNPPGLAIARAVLEED